MGGHGQFQLIVDVGADSDRGIEVFGNAERGEEDKGGGMAQDIRHRTISSTKEQGRGATGPHTGRAIRLVAANSHTIPNPNLIHPGDIVRVPRD